MKFFHKCLASEYCIPDSIHRKPKDEFLIHAKEYAVSRNGAAGSEGRKNQLV